MQTEVYEGSALPYVLAKPDGFAPDAAYPLVVMLHGFGASMYDLAGLASVIDAQGYVYAFPNAPYRLDLGYGSVGFSWAVNRPGVEPPPPGAPSTDERLDAFFAELIPQVNAQPGQIVLGGFSQGGGLTLRYGLPRAETFCGLICLSGAFRDPDEVRLPAKRDQRIFVAQGRYDPTVGIEVGRATKEFLEAAGYTPTYREYDMGHEIPASVIRDIIPMLHETLPPKA